MTRILFIGNSHIGSLKYSVNELSKQSEYSQTLSRLKFSFCGTAGAVGMSLIGHHAVIDLASRGYQEFMLTTGGETSIDLDNFDIICLVGSLTTLDIRYFSSSSFSPLSEACVFNITTNLMKANFHSNLIYGQIIQQYAKNTIGCQIHASLIRLIYYLRIILRAYHKTSGRYARLI